MIEKLKKIDGVSYQWTIVFLILWYGNQR
jgi:hypothetical protein